MVIFVISVPMPIIVRSVKVTTIDILLKTPIMLPMSHVSINVQLGIPILQMLVELACVICVAHTVRFVSTQLLVLNV